MLKSSFILLLFLSFAQNLLAQTPEVSDYDVYSAIIKTEISDTAKSVTILKYLEKEDDSKWVVDAIETQNIHDLQQVYFMTRTIDDERVTSINASIQRLIADYYTHQQKDELAKEKFHLNAKVFLIKKLESNNKSPQENWKSFYEKNSGSGGIFGFSKIFYSEGKDAAVCYFWHRRNAANGYGNLAIMKNINGEWQIQYEIILWQA
jgi:hypothetical protein